MGRGGQGMKPAGRVGGRPRSGRGPGLGAGRLGLAGPAETDAAGCAGDGPRCAGVLKVRIVQSSGPATMGGAAHRREDVVHPRMLAAGLGAPASPSSDGSLEAACKPGPGIACRLMWDLTHSTRAADLTKVFFAGPVHQAIRIGFVILVALIIRLAAHRAIRKITTRATKDSPDATDRSPRQRLRRARHQPPTPLRPLLTHPTSL